MNDNYETLIRLINDAIAELRVTGNLNIYNFLSRAESTFNEAGFRENLECGVENILIVKLDSAGDFIMKF